MTTRTDIHRPAAPEFDPQAYDYFGAFDFRPEFGDGGHRIAVVNNLIDQGYRFGAPGGGKCGHCGTRIRYAALLGRADVKEMIYVGEQCLDNRFDLTKGEFDTLRLTGRLNRERTRKIEKIEALVTEHPLLADLTYPEILDNNFLVDVGFRFRDKGLLTDRQIEAVEKVLRAGIERRAQRVAEQVVRLEQAPNLVFLAEVGTKVEVTGTVRFRRYLDGQYGTTTLLVLDVETDNGPAIVKWFASKGLEVDRGDTVTLKATVKAQETYQGQKQTVITRGRIIE